MFIFSFAWFRGLAVDDHTSPHGLRLVIKDYPYVVDGLEIWDAIKTWVQEYVNLYYSNDKAVEKDTKLQAWWKEVMEKGNSDWDKVWLRRSEWMTKTEWVSDKPKALMRCN